MIKEITEKEFEVETKDKRVVVDFHATWCGPCKMLGSVMEKYIETHDDEIIKIDIDNNPNLVNKFNIMSVPTLIILNDGKEEKRISGFMSLDELKEWIK